MAPKKKQAADMVAMRNAHAALTEKNIALATLTSEQLYNTLSEKQVAALLGQLTYDLKQTKPSEYEELQELKKGRSFLKCFHFDFSKCIAIFYNVVLFRISDFYQ